MSTQTRTTILGCMFLNTVSSSSVVEFGDSGEADLTSRVLAIQRAIPNYEEDEFRFAAYPIFFLPKLTLQPCTEVSFHSCSPSPIQVGSIRSLGVSASSLLRVGCGGPLQAESRIKHIRHFNNRDIR